MCVAVAMKFAAMDPIIMRKAQAKKQVDEEVERRAKMTSRAGL